MYREISRLILFSDLPEDSILLRIASVCRDLQESKPADLNPLIHRVYAEIKRLLDLSTTYGFDRNLWQCYLTFLLVSHENSFSLVHELTEPGEGSITDIAKDDFSVFLRLFHFDFSPMEEALGIRCFSRITHYRAVRKPERIYNRSVSEAICSLSAAIDRAQDSDEVYRLVTDHYQRYGAGLFGMNCAFRVNGTVDSLQFLPISNLDTVSLKDLVGYELQKQQLRANIEAFISGKPYNNTLLYGDAGTGKSTSVKAVLHEYQDRGLRLIELYKHQFSLLSTVISQIKKRHYCFLIFIDDLSFEENEVDYKFLKAVIEGGIETRPDNIMIIATSNRRHLIRETWRDRADMEHEEDIHHSDTVEEKLSLAARFGCAIRYPSPDRRLFQDIVLELAARNPSVTLSRDELLAAANQWELRHGGVSGRTAQQFINAVAGHTVLPSKEHPHGHS